MSEDAKEVVVDTVNKETVIKEYLGSQSYIDNINAEKGKWAESYKTEKLPGMVETEVEARLKAQATKTPEQIKFDDYENRLATMQNQIAEKEKEGMRNTNKDLARNKFKEAGIPDTLLDFFVTEDATKTESNIATAIEAMTGFQTQIKQGVLGDNNTKVPGKTDTDTIDVNQAPEGLSKAEYVAWFKNHRNK